MKRKASVLILSCIFASPVFAAWYPIATTDVSKVTVDTNSLRREGDLVKVWAMSDLFTSINGEKGKIRSFKTQYLINCKEEKNATLYTAFFSGPQGGGVGAGSVDRTSDEPKFIPNVPESVVEKISKFVCKVTEE